MPHKGTIKNLAPSAKVQEQRDRGTITFPHIIAVAAPIFRVTEDGFTRITEAGDFRILNG